MRRFSQRNQLVTLNEINITPLLDLAFVLLIIFVITTPLMEQSIKLDLPGGGTRKTKASEQDVRQVEVTPDGFYLIRGQKLNIQQLESRLAQEFQANRNLAVYVRADRNEAFERIVALLDVCERHDIKRLAFATKQEKR